MSRKEDLIVVDGGDAGGGLDIIQPSASPTATIVVLPRTLSSAAGLAEEDAECRGYCVREKEGGGTSSKGVSVY